MKQIYNKVKLLQECLGLSNNGLRLYEKEGIIRPRYNKQNGYREISITDGALMSIGISYTKSGFTLKEVSDLLWNMDVRSQAAALEDRDRAMDEEILELIRHRRLISEKIKSFQLYLANPNFCRIVANCPLLFLPIHDDSLAQMQSARDSSAWAKRRPYSAGSRYLSPGWEKFDEGKPLPVLSGTSLWEDDALRVGVPTSNAYRMGEGRLQYVQAFIRTNTQNPLLNEDLKHILQYIDDNSLEISGGACTRMFTCEASNEAVFRYEEVWIPVKLKPAE